MSGRRFLHCLDLHKLSRPRRLSENRLVARPSENVVGKAAGPKSTKA